MSPSEQPPLPDTEMFEDTSDIRYSERYFTRRRIANKLVGAAILLDLLYLGAYKTPVIIEQARLSGTEPSLIHVSDTPNHLAAETVVIGGFGIKNSTPIAEALPQLGEIGAVNALEQDNEGIDAHVIAQMIIQQATAQGFTEIGLWGDSNGGHTVGKIAREIQQDNSLLRVRYIVLDCIPTSLDSLQPDKRQTVNTLSWANNSWVSFLFPDITSHPLVSYLYTQQRLRAAYPNSGGGFSVQQVLNETYDPNEASSTLLAAEALEVVNNSLASDLKAVATVKDKQPPLIISIRPQSDTGDTTVISDVAEKQLTSIVGDAGLTLLKVNLTGIVHGDPTANRDQYQQALKDIILPAIKQYDMSINSRLYQIDSVR